MNSFSHSYEELMEDYWDRRLRNPKLAVVAVTVCNLYFQIYNIKNPLTELARYVNIGYTVISFLTVLLVAPSFVNRKYNKYVRYGFMLAAIRNIIFVYNISDTRDKQSVETWTVFC